MWVDGMMTVYIDSGRLADSSLLEASDILAHLGLLYIDGDHTRPARLYGDPAYADGTHVKRKGKGAHRTAAQRRKDGAMVVVRGTVEQGFGKVGALWSHLDYSKKIRLWSSPTVDEWMCGCFLTNIHTCVYASQMNVCLGVQPPDLSSYLKSAHDDLLV